MVKSCPGCGHPLPDETVEFALTPKQCELYKAVKRSGQNGISNPDLMDRLYANNPDGGASNSNIIAVMIRKMRVSMKPFGLNIRSDGGPGSRYYLEKIDV